MTRTELEAKSLVELREIAKEMGVRSIPKYRKGELIDLIEKGEVPPRKKPGRKAGYTVKRPDEEVIETNAEEDDFVSVEDDEPDESDANAAKLPDPERFVSEEYVPQAKKNMSPESMYQPMRDNTDKQRGGYIRQDDQHQQDRQTSTRGYAPYDERQSRYSRDYQPRQRQDNYRQDNYRQDNYRQDNYRQSRDGYTQRYNAADRDRDRRPADRRTYERVEGYYNSDYGTTNSAVPEMIEQGECRDVAGVLEIMDAYGFIRTDNYYAGTKDIYIAIAQIRRFTLRAGDYIEGKARPRREGDKFEALMYIERVNGVTPEEILQRPNFDELTPIFPQERYTLEIESEKNDLASRLIDLIAPIGKGSRAMIVSQPKAGKTTLLKNIARGITTNSPEAHLIVLLVDERPEEVTDMKRSVKGEVIYSTFDEMPEHHAKVSQMVQERAMRLVEMGKDVVILLDSLTRLTRAYNLIIPPTGKTLSGGMDPGAFYKPKRFFGAARNIEGGGSLTIIATALVETGSKLDDIVYEEFKGTGNLEIHLDRKLAEKRIFPAIDIYKSGTRREDLLLSKEELDGVYMLRRVMAGGASTDVTEQLIAMLSKTATNDEFLTKLKEWVRIYEKEGFVAGNSQSRF